MKESLTPDQLLAGIEAIHQHWPEMSTQDVIALTIDIYGRWQDGHYTTLIVGEKPVFQFVSFWIAVGTRLLKDQQKRRKQW